VSDDATCSNCRFFEPDSSAGACRRYAPRVQFERNHNIKKKRWLQMAYAIWPLVAPDDWCGEHTSIAERPA
jgi:hypothetical protein